MQPHDEKVLEAVSKQAVEATLAHNHVAECAIKADEAAAGLSPVSVATPLEREAAEAAFLVANYQKKDRQNQATRALS